MHRIMQNRGEAGDGDWASESLYGASGVSKIRFAVIVSTKRELRKYSV